MPKLDTANPPNDERVGTALLSLVRHPLATFVYSWNWKAATLSPMLRAPVFLFATLKHGRSAVEMAVAVEWLYSAAISGCYGAFTQRIRFARPLWLSALLLTVIMPALLLWLDYLLHLWTGMPNLKNGIIAAGVFASLSSVFNWYIMRRGNLIVGREGVSFASDLEHLPRLLLDFILLVFLFVPRQGMRAIRRGSFQVSA